MLKKHYKVLSLLLSMLMVVGLFAGCSPAAPTNEGVESSGETGGEKIYELSLAHFWPASHIMETEIAQGWAQAVFEATNGRVKINTYPGETLTKAAEVYEGVVQGVADIGISVYAYTRGRFPVLETLLLPGISFYNSEAASWAAMEAIEILDPEELKDVHHIWTWGSGPADLLSKKPIRTPADLKGLQIGATAGPRADALEILGAAPVISPLSEWYEALSRGVMDGGVIPLESLLGFRLAEVTADYITLTPFLYNQLFFNVMNKETWESLPADIQEAITAATEEFYAEKMPTLWNRINKEGLEYGRSIKDIEIIKLTEEETKLWVEPLKPIHDEYVEFLNSRGLPGEEILEQMKALAQKYGELYPDFAPYVN